MNTSPTTKSFVLAAACALGLATAAVADPGTAPGGLIGTDYFHTDLSYTDLAHTDVDSHGVNIAYNQRWREGLDAQFGYSYERSEPFAGGLHLREQSIDLGARLYTEYRGFKPFATAGIGWVWDDAPAGFDDNSFTWFAGVGAEFQLTSQLSLQPYVTFKDATDYNGAGTWNFGVRANHWLTQRVALTAGVNYDDDDNVNYSAGINFRF